MSNIKVSSKKMLSIQDLQSDLELEIKKDAFMVVLNQEPPNSWVKVNKFAGNSKYIPIEKVEWLLRRLFKNPKFEIRQQGTVFNSVWCTVRIHYFNPATNEWEFQDGTGASQIQTKAGSSPSEMQNIGQGAVEKAIPDAYSAAVKNAAKKIGKIFGSDLNRDAPLAYSTDEKLKDLKEIEERNRLKAVIENSKTKSGLEDAKIHIKEDDAEMLELWSKKWKEVSSEKV